MRRRWFILSVTMACIACGGTPPPEPDQPKINPQSVPSLDLLGSVQRGDAEGTGDGPSCRDVINEEMEALWAGNKTAKAALDTAVDRGNKLLRKFERSAK